MIWIVEDSAALASVIKTWLDRETEASEIIPHAADVLARLDAGVRPSIILLDLKLDGQPSGNDIMRHMIEIASDIPVIVITGNGDMMDKDLLDYPKAILHKPFRKGIGEIIKLVEEHRLTSDDRRKDLGSLARSMASVSDFLSRNKTAIAAIVAALATIAGAVATWAKNYFN